MKPFEVAWSESEIADVWKKVGDCKLPPVPANLGWSQGCDADFLKHVQSYWVEKYDWRAAMADLNRYPQFIANVDGLDIHFLHIIGEAGGKRPLIISHGWPGSHYEFWNVIERLAYPTRSGGRAEDAFDLVIPSLPGFGFSGRPETIISQRKAAALFNKLMTEVLGYKRYFAQGGDFGSMVTSWLGFDHGSSVAAIHLNMMTFRNAAPPANDAENAWMQKAAAAQRQFSGYSAVQMFKPLSLIWATADNPLGQAAWILERFHDWADLQGRDVTDVFGLDHLLTNIMMYVMTGSFSSAILFYPGVLMDGGIMLPVGTRCETPTAYANFPGDTLLPPPPRSRFESTYNLTRWTDMPKGGHFAAMEQPVLFAEDVIAWGRDLSL